MKKILCIACILCVLLLLGGCSGSSRQADSRGDAIVSELNAFMQNLKFELEELMAKEDAKKITDMLPSDDASKEEWRDKIRMGAGGFLQFLAKLEGDPGLTEDGALQGKRMPGVDSYTGSYAANYESYTGTERVFGGVCLIRPLGNTVDYACSLQIDEGEAQVVFFPSSLEPQVLLSQDGNASGSLEVNEMTSYVGVICKDFSGSVDISTR